MQLLGAATAAPRRFVARGGRAQLIGRSVSPTTSTTCLFLTEPLARADCVVVDKTNIHVTRVRPLPPMRSALCSRVVKSIRSCNQVRPLRSLLFLVIGEWVAANRAPEPGKSPRVATDGRQYRERMSVASRRVRGCVALDHLVHVEYSDASCFWNRDRRPR
jgi:hypothetical protein